MSQRGLAPAVVLAAALGTFVLAGGWVLSARSALTMVSLAAAVVVARRHPDRAATAAVVLIAAVPIYWAPPIPGTLIGATAAVVGSAVLVPAVLDRLGEVRLTAFDALVFGYFAVVALSYLVVYQQGAGLAARTLLETALPFAVFRVLAVAPGAPRRWAIALVWVALPLSILGLFERAGTDNPLFTLFPPRYQGGTWAREQVRFDTVRAEASFGHSIPFGLFLATVLVLVVALAYRRRTGPPRRPAGRLVIAGAAALLTYTLVATLSRLAVVVVILGLVVFVATARGARARARLLVTVAVAVALVLISPAGAVLQELQDTASGETAEAASARYRIELFSLITDSSNLSILGRGAEVEGGVTESAGETVGLASIDNEYAVVFLGNGVIAMGLFLLIGVGLWRILLRRHLDDVDRGWVAVTASTMVGLAAVALLTQQKTLFWIAVAVSAAANARARDSAVATAAQLPELVPASVP